MKWGIDLFDYYLEQTIRYTLKGINKEEWMVKVAFNLGIFKIYIYASDPEYNIPISSPTKEETIEKYLKKVYNIKTIKHGRHE